MTIGPEHPDHPGYQGGRERPDQQPGQQPQHQWPQYTGPDLRPGHQHPEDGPRPAPYGYGQHGAPYASPRPMAPVHPQATTALTLGLIGLIGTFLCVLPVVLGPFAWAIGARAKRDIARYPGRYRGEGEANTGMILGIVATVLLVLAVLAVVLFVLLAVALADTPSSTYSDV